MSKYREIVFLCGGDEAEFIDALDSGNPDEVEATWCNLTNFDVDYEDDVYMPDISGNVGESEEWNDDFPGYVVVVNRGLGYVSVYFKED